VNARVRSVVLAVGALAAVQLVAYGVYRAVESPASSAPGRFAPDVIDEAAPPLELEAHDGRKVALHDERGPLLLHFWATWCAPCRTELPSLIDLVPELERRGVRVVLASVDETWPVIAHYFDGEVPSRVLRALDARAPNAFGIPSLPGSVLVDARGRAVARWRGAHDWSAPGAADAVARWSTAR
jgi:thiol-disulfide isomerase/thioredoxin